MFFLASLPKFTFVMGDVVTTSARLGQGAHASFPMAQCCVIFAPHSALEG